MKNDKDICCHKTGVCKSETATDKTVVRANNIPFSGGSYPEQEFTIFIDASGEAVSGEDMRVSEVKIYLDNVKNVIVRDADNEELSILPFVSIYVDINIIY